MEKKENVFDCVEKNGKTVGRFAGTASGISAGVKVGGTLACYLPGDYTLVKQAACVFACGLVGGTAGFFIGDKFGKVIDKFISEPDVN